MRQKPQKNPKNKPFLHLQKTQRNATAVTFSSHDGTLAPPPLERLRRLQSILISTSFHCHIHFFQSLQNIDEVRTLSVRILPTLRDQPVRHEAASPNESEKFSDKPPTPLAKSLHTMSLQCHHVGAVSLAKTTLRCHLLFYVTIPIAIAFLRIQTLKQHMMCIIHHNHNP